MPKASHQRYLWQAGGGETAGERKQWAMSCTWGRSLTPGPPLNDTSASQYTSLVMIFRAARFLIGMPW